MTSTSPSWRATPVSTLRGVAAQHGGLGGDAVGQAAEGGIEGVPQALPGVVVPDLAQLGPGEPAAVGRQPGQHGDQQGIVVVGELGRLAQRVHTAR
jgi:hypothetical protein